jgi:hemolysin III
VRVNREKEYEQVAASRNEELANTLSHGLGLLAAVAATPVLIVSAARNGTAANIVGGSVFGVSMVMLYLASTWYHATPVGPRKDRLRRLDHAAIYLLIAGSYTPFTLGVLRGPLGWTLFGIVWGVAAIGVFEKLKSGVRYPRLSTILYVIMGWLALIAIKPLLLNMPTQGLAWLVAGGLSYTGGVVFYTARNLRYHHFIWHLFVLAGTVCHFFAALWYAGGTR